MDYRDISPYWRLHDAFTASEAAALIYGADPKKVRLGYKADLGVGAYNEIITVEAALKKAIYDGVLIPSTMVKTQVKTQNGFNVVHINDINWEDTLISCEGAKAWLLSKGIKTGFFFPENEGVIPDTPGYLNPSHNRYSPRLAAAVKAWEAMEDANLLKGKTPQSAMKIWLESRYKELGLVHKRAHEKNGYKRGDINTAAINEAAKVANWQDETMNKAEVAINE